MAGQVQVRACCLRPTLWSPGQDHAGPNIFRGPTSRSVFNQVGSGVFCMLQDAMDYLPTLL